MLNISLFRMVNLMLMITLGLGGLTCAHCVTPRMNPSSGPFSNTSFVYNGTLAPYVRNVTADYAWVVPRSKFDFGARDMTCECFDPAGEFFVSYDYIPFHNSNICT